VLQTMPIYLFVIPAVIVIGSGPVGGVFATILYAMPPVARMTWLALINTDQSVVDASRSFGATARQVLTSVRFPLGIPTVLAGLNQAIMLSLAMAVISAFIGTPGLGSTILVALTEADMANGFAAGLSMLVLAVVFDRIMRGLIGRVRSTEHVIAH
jgi:glycine betaine/proline transport system permease protein